MKNLELFLKNYLFVGLCNMYQYSHPMAFSLDFVMFAQLVMIHTSNLAKFGDI
jgi:hypothetical protein